MIQRLLFVSTLLAVNPAGLAAQGDPTSQPASGRLRVFLDCNDCFETFIRDEVTFVEYVRDRVEADVHIIVTTSATGSGGRERAVAFIGAGRFAGVDQALRATSEAGESEERERQALASVITIGLLTYEARDGIGRGLEVSVSEDRDQAVAAIVDSWDNWVLSVEAGLSAQGEETSRETRLEAEFGANRVTDAWKIELEGRLEYNVNEEFDLDEDDPVLATRDERQFETLVVKSLGDHWSAGASSEITSSSFENLEWQVFAAPAVEFNVFPYSAYTRRQLRMNYAIGPYHAKYIEKTLFGQTSDTLGRQEASITLDQRETWGSVLLRFEASSFLPDLESHRLELEGDLSLRIARGLSLTVEASAGRIRDQLALAGSDATDEEVLLRLRRLQSGYEYQLELGISYVFGSIFNTIVNPRFGLDDGDGDGGN